MDIRKIVGPNSEISPWAISGADLETVPAIWNDIVKDDEYGLSGLRAQEETFGVIWDIGGNVGLFSKVAAMIWPEAEVHAWEPNPLLFEHFERNAPTAILHRSAAAVFPGKAGFYPCRMVGNSCMEWSFGDANMPQQDNRLEVDCERPWETAPAPDFVKMDCEGSEHYLLFHMPVRPKVMVVEMHGPHAHDPVQRASHYRPEYTWCETRFHAMDTRVLMGRLNG